MERYWVWEYGLFEKNPKRVDSLNPETTLEVVKLADAQATVEALQRERDKLREATKVICGHCCEPMAIPSKAILQSQLSALQGLVRALPVVGLPAEHARPDDFILLKTGEGWMAHTYNYWAKFATEEEARAYIALLEYRASLPAQRAKLAQGGAGE